VDKPSEIGAGTPATAVFGNGAGAQVMSGVPASCWVSGAGGVVGGVVGGIAGGIVESVAGGVAGGVVGGVAGGVVGGVAGGVVGGVAGGVAVGTAVDVAGGAARGAGGGIADTTTASMGSVAGAVSTNGSELGIVGLAEIGTAVGTDVVRGCTAGICVAAT
jgi:hypothetical protein